MLLKGNSNRYEEDVSTAGILGTGPLGGTSVERVYVAGDKVVAKGFSELEVHSRIPLSSVDKGNGGDQVHRNLDSCLITKGTRADNTRDTGRSSQSGLGARKGDSVHDKAEENRVVRKEIEQFVNGQAESGLVEQDVLYGNVSVTKVGAEPSVETPPGLCSVEMEVDKRVMSHMVSSQGVTEMVENKAGPKVRKWKR
ncbi:hypothetical protein Q3G72_001581 [Acer saccharum]|nr:hypothetical protein Q3G72_001581 [Acer saccharum]